jgi:hypothetical protein
MIDYLAKNLKECALCHRVGWFGFVYTQDEFWPDMGTVHCASAISCLFRSAAAQDRTLAARTHNIPWTKFGRERRA